MHTTILPTPILLPSETVPTPIPFLPHIYPAAVYTLKSSTSIYQRQAQSLTSHRPDQTRSQARPASSHSGPRRHCSQPPSSGYAACQSALHHPRWQQQPRPLFSRGTSQCASSSRICPAGTAASAGFLPALGTGTNREGRNERIRHISAGVLWSLAHTIEQQHRPSHHRDYQERME